MAVRVRGLRPGRMGRGRGRRGRRLLMGLRGGFEGGDDDDVG